MDGLEVTERIKAKCPWTPVVVVTGYGTAENEARASVLGASGFVNKPLTPEIIESITLKALSGANTVAKPENRAETPAAEVIKTANNTGALRKAGVLAKNAGLFFVAPFIALAYIIALPAVGFYMMAKLGYQAYAKRRQSA
jgi:DNA-binding NtrC family response regulator